MEGTTRCCPVTLAPCPLCLCSSFRLALPSHFLRWKLDTRSDQMPFLQWSFPKYRINLSICFPFCCLCLCLDLKINTKLYVSYLWTWLFFPLHCKLFKDQKMSYLTLYFTQSRPWCQTMVPRKCWCELNFLNWPALLFTWNWTRLFASCTVSVVRTGLPHKDIKAKTQIYIHIIDM